MVGRTSKTPNGVIRPCDVVGPYTPRSPGPNGPGPTGEAGGVLRGIMGSLRVVHAQDNDGVGASRGLGRGYADIREHPFPNDSWITAAACPRQSCRKCRTTAKAPATENSQGSWSIEREL